MSLSAAVPQGLNEQDRQAIVTHLNELDGVGEEEAMRSFGLELPGKPSVFVKQGHGILSEGITQHFIYLLSLNDESAPRVPRVIDIFCQGGYSVVVMENIKAPPLSKCDISEDEAVEYAASAVKWLMDQLPSIPEATFGRITTKAARVWYQFFKDHQAPRVFANSVELAQYVLKVLILILTIFVASQRCRWEGEAFPAEVEDLLTFFGDARCIYHCDINKDNFLLDRFSAHRRAATNLPDPLLPASVETWISTLEECGCNGTRLERASAVWRECQLEDGQRLLPVNFFVRFDDYLRVSSLKTYLIHVSPWISGNSLGDRKELGPLFVLEDRRKRFVDPLEEKRANVPKAAKLLV
ncbi:hypothetical protein BDN70DRAFT_919889 [Pholiota conissans]|uniref:Aminoglycoside phosphotransferase domain-containing protein n=1 Tax=Pholiota conissans TaxID=109636 RepID=A0A9P6CV37_9AGAR|nr:hypothetical protein BDN70DRAFT_919889 [Pholiota conissans]